MDQKQRMYYYYNSAMRGDLETLINVLDEELDCLCRGETLLHISARTGHTEIVEYLLDRGASPNSCSVDLETPLHFARKPSITSSLLLAGAEVDACSKKGETPLSAVLRHESNAESVEVARLLLRAGADPNHKDHQGNTPTHSAITTCRRDVVDLFYHSNADFFITSRLNPLPPFEIATVSFLPYLESLFV